jgi:hypothetical protein
MRRIEGAAVMLHKFCRLPWPSNHYPSSKPVAVARSEPLVTPDVGYLAEIKNAHTSALSEDLMLELTFGSYTYIQNILPGHRLLWNFYITEIRFCEVVKLVVPGAIGVTDACLLHKVSAGFGLFLVGECDRRT